MHFQFEQIIALPRDRLFAFHENPENLELLHCGWSRLRLLHHDGGIRPGSRTWVETTVAGILPVAMGFEHTVHEPPQRFGERLIHGPFRHFTHIHEFEPVQMEVRAQPGTLVRDLLEVELPWCYGGAPATKQLLAPMIRRVFRFRQQALSRLAQRGAIADRTTEAGKRLT